MDDFTLVLFGATGDLTRRKLLPALYRLIAQKKVKKLLVVGVAIEDTTVEEILSRAESFCDTKKDKAAWQALKACMHYQQLDFTQSDDYVRLAALIEKEEQKKGLSGNRLLYLATAAQFFCDITDNSAKAKIATRIGPKEKPWNRIVYEKPFGHNLQSAHEINECIKKYFDESQVYRIDHFLTKELVNNISLIRFTNAVFEPLWDHRYIEEVQIILSEKIALEGRGGYYDKYGALCDVVQNHMLELLALIGMEAPKKLTGNFIRDERAKVLEDVQVEGGFLGQYEGYTKEKNVAPDSKTDTFAVLRLAVDNARWAGVPFYLKTGKCLNKKETVIQIKFKQVECLMLENCPTPANWLTIRVSPDAAFSLQLNVKKPGKAELVPVDMEFCHSCIFGAWTPEAYEVLFEEVVRGEQSISVRFDEIEYAWRIIDHIKDMKLPLYQYECDTLGPEKALEEFEKKNAMRFKS